MWEDDIYSLYFIEDEDEEEFTRTRVTLINVFEGLGGFLEIILIASAFIVAPVNSFLYQAFLVRNLYLTQMESKQDDQNSIKFLKLQESTQVDEDQIALFAYLRRKIVFREFFNYSFGDMVCSSLCCMRLGN